MCVCLGGLYVCQGGCLCDCMCVYFFNVFYRLCICLCDVPCVVLMRSYGYMGDYGDFVVVVDVGLCDKMFSCLWSRI